MGANRNVLGRNFFMGHIDPTKEVPSVAAFAEMIRDPVYREAVKHRQAAVEDSRLIRHAVLPIGKTFGEIPK